MKAVLPVAAAIALIAAPAGAQTLGDCMQRDDLTKAVATCTALVKAAGKDRPKLATATAFLGTAQRAQGDYRNAVATLSQALILDPRNARLWHERALARAALGQLVRATADETYALRYEPRMIEALISRSDLFRQIGILGRAVADATEALKLDPNSAEAFANRAYAQLRQGRPNFALADAEEALKRDPRSARALLTRGLVTEKTDAAKAREDLKRALDLDPKKQIAIDALKRLGA